MPVAQFVTGNHENVLGSGELLRSIFLSAHALRKRFAFRRFTLTHLGRSEALVIGTKCLAHGEFVLTITAATLRPIQLIYESTPGAAELKPRSTTPCRSACISTTCMGRRRIASN